MTYQYPDRAIFWTDGSPIPAELREALLAGLEPGFEIEHGEFAWEAEKSLTMTFRLCIARNRPRPEIWEVKLSYPAKDATAARAEATPEEREWFTMMIRTHIDEWWATGRSVVTAARHIK